MAQSTQLPGGGQTMEDGGQEAERREPPDRREEPDRRHGFGRRASDRRNARLGLLRSAFWALVGSAVVLYLFFIALDAIHPRDSETVSLVVLVLAVLWLGHAWRNLFLGAGGGSRTDRERRGF